MIPILLSLWIVAQIAQIGLGFRAYRRRWMSVPHRRVGSLLLSAIVAPIPLLMLLIAPAQLGLLEPEAWIGILTYVPPAACALAFLIALLPPHPPRDWLSPLSRWLGVVSAACAWAIVWIMLPSE